MTPIALSLKRKINDKLDFLNIENFCSLKISMETIKRQAFAIFANHMTDEGPYQNI